MNLANLYVTAWLPKTLLETVGTGGDRVPKELNPLATHPPQHVGRGNTIQLQHGYVICRWRMIAVPTEHADLSSDFVFHCFWLLSGCNFFSPLRFHHNRW